MRDLKPKFTEKQLGMNPHIASLEVLVSSLTLKDKYYQTDEGEWLPVEQELERVPMAKLYCTSERRKLTSHLSVRAKELMVWIMYELDFGKDYIWINKGLYMHENEIKSVDTYKAALSDLIRNCYITPTSVHGVYWINPDFFFKGDRIGKYKDKIVLYKPKSKE